MSADLKAIDLNNLEMNYFELFAVPESFTVDVPLLSERYRDLQKQAHPDRFSQADEQQQLLAVRFSAHLNDALDTLKSPLKRAAYLLKLAGVELVQEGTAALPPAFLMQQMQLREALEESADADDSEAALDELREQGEALWQQLLQDFQQALADGQVLAAETEYRKMQFIHKLLNEIELREEELLD